MKPTDIQRGIESQHRRKHKDKDPGLAKVVRLRQSDVLKGRRHRWRHSGHGNLELKRRLRLLSSVIGLASLLVIGVTFLIWLNVRLTPDLDFTKREEFQPAQEEKEENVRVTSKFPSPNREEALEMVRRAIANRDPEKITSFFRCGSASVETIVEFLNNMTVIDGPIQHYEWMCRMDREGMPVEGVLVEAKGKNGPMQRLALLTPDLSGKWKMDFEAFARTVSPSWDELLVKGANQGIVRVFVGKGSYYNGPFRDESQWVSYGMVSPDIEEVLLGYCRMGSNEATVLNRLFSEGQKMRRMTLEIKRVKEGEPRQFEIIRVMAEDWILGDAPDGDS